MAIYVEVHPSPTRKTGGDSGVLTVSPTVTHPRVTPNNYYLFSFQVVPLQCTGLGYRSFTT